MVYEWDEAKREANLRKHGLDFDDADIVYENPNKITFAIHGRDEARWLDIALCGIERNRSCSRLHRSGIQYPYHFIPQGFAEGKANL